MRLAHSLDLRWRPPVQDQTIRAVTNYMAASCNFRAAIARIIHAEMVAGRSRVDFVRDSPIVYTRFTPFLLIGLRQLIRNYIVSRLLMPFIAIFLTVGERHGLVLAAASSEVILEARARHRTNDLLCQDTPIAVFHVVVVHHDHHLVSGLHHRRLLNSLAVVVPLGLILLLDCCRR